MKVPLSRNLEVDLPFSGTTGTYFEAARSAGRPGLDGRSGPSVDPDRPGRPGQRGRGGTCGSGSDPALRRAAAFGDGWYAFYLRADEVAERIGALSGYCRENGRDLSKLTVAVALSNPHPDVLPELAAAGVTEFVVAEAPPSAPAAAGAWVAELADHWAVSRWQ